MIPMEFVQASQKPLIFVSWLGVALASLLSLFFISQQLWQKSFLAGAVLLPAMILMAKSHKLIPAKWLLIYVSVTFFNVICMGWELYNKIPYMDDFAHLVTSFSLAPCLAFVMFGSPFRKRALSKNQFMVVGVCLVVFVGVSWEILEFLIGARAGYMDTIMDLLWDVTGASASSYLMIRSGDVQSDKY